MLIVRDAIELDGMNLAPRLNKSDKYSIEVYHQCEVEDVLLNEIRMGCKSVVDTETKVCYALFGDEELQGKINGRLVWFMVSDDFLSDRKRMKQFIREYKSHLMGLVNKYTYLTNYHLTLPDPEEDKIHRRLIEFMGFTFTPEPIQMAIRGFTGSVFYMEGTK